MTYVQLDDTVVKYTLELVVEQHETNAGVSSGRDRLYDEDVNLYQRPSCDIAPATSASHDSLMFSNRWRALITPSM